MANPHKGEVEFTVGAKAYKAVLTTNAICELETVLGRSVTELENRITTTRAVLWASLIEHQPKVTLADVGKMVDELGLIKATEIVRDIYTLAFPAAQGPLAEQPASQQAGTGKDSSAPG